ncbi:hypothetical protein [Streptomyces mangrovisoli]|uniref:Uncharacterized protein n=1 Tax=Streptomyces mangrovisoli TaxID=1428628 RepID=A0A1J4P1S8_9ACTN|nr:hypothetical protein [Streptomyces mangrovisoli]OIJ68170.1 hypothetical protein WN71_008990 [Streptomyces mangrovisoli]
MPRKSKKARRLVADGHTYLWRLRHRHSVTESGRSCVQTLTLFPEPAGTGGGLRIVFAEGPGRYVPGGAPLGSGDVGYTHGASLNLHEPGAVRALLDAAAAHGRRPEERGVREIDGWTLLEAAAAAREAGPDGGLRARGRLTG